MQRKRKTANQHTQLGGDSFKNEIIGECSDCWRNIQRKDFGWIILASNELLCDRCYHERFETEGR